jgi:hypothetical protein
LSLPVLDLVTISLGGIKDGSCWVLERLVVMRGLYGMK